MNSGPAVEQSIDLNADLGEGYGQWEKGDDLAILDVVSSASIACGFHAGDPLTMRTCTRAAVERGVCIGAHVSYFDIRGFGRRFIDVEQHELTADLIYQIGALTSIAKSVGGNVSYVKPHGALYNAAVHHESHAAAIVNALTSIGTDLALYLLKGSVLDQMARDAGVRTVAEGFVDRAYNPDGSLADRRNPGAVRYEVDAVVAQALSLASDGTATTIEGHRVKVVAETLCLHGDTPGARHSAVEIRQALTDAGITIRATC